MTEQATSYVASSIDRKVISSETYRNKVTTQKKICKYQERKFQESARSSI